MGNFNSSNKKSKKQPNKVSRQVDENDQAVMRIKLQRDKIVLKRNDLQKKVAQALLTVRALARERRKDEAVYYLGKKRILEKSLQAVGEKLRYVEGRIARIEDVQDEAEFTSIVQDSNQVLRALLERVDVEAVHEAAELDRAVNASDEQVLAEIRRGLQDPEVMREYDELDRDARAVSGGELDRQIADLVRDKDRDRDEREDNNGDKDENKYENKPREERELAYN